MGVCVSTNKDAYPSSLVPWVTRVSIWKFATSLCVCTAIFFGSCWEVHLARKSYNWQVDASCHEPPTASIPSQVKHLNCSHLCLWRDISYINPKTLNLSNRPLTHLPLTSRLRKPATTHCTVHRLHSLWLRWRGPSGHGVTRFTVALESIQWLTLRP